jgi:3-deoxy-manno-octulosonate cytidylyltransferase (CMP-KDO synthetase)
MKIIGVIPARFGSSRLPGKVLADIGGKPMIQHVFENARKSRYLEDILIAVDDLRVQEVVEKFGGKAVMTDPNLPSGTDRVAAAIKDLEVEIVVNIQSDEPFSNAAIIDEAIQPMLDNPKIQFSTVMHRIDNKEGYDDPGVVKTVRDAYGFGLYFSRSLIPHPRYKEDYDAFEHLGIYAYRKDALLRFVSWGPSPLEQVESLEMLRILDHDEKIFVAKSAQPFYSLSVDTEEDLKRAREFYKKQLEKGGNFTK